MSDLATPISINRYAVFEELGSGGMGAVYRATDRLTGSDVALKRVAVPVHSLDFHSKAGFGDVRLALIQEFQILAGLRHPHIVSVLDYGFDNERQPYFTMELLAESLPLHEAAAPLPVTTRIHLIIQVLQALAYLHRHGILHRDVKPGNVLVTPHAKNGSHAVFPDTAADPATTHSNGDYHVHVVDFGLAAAGLEAGGLAGTLAYLAPEVLRDFPFSIASDLYAVGILAYELLVGHHPYDVTNIGDLIEGILYHPPDIHPLETLDLNARPVYTPPAANSDLGDTFIMNPAALRKYHDPNLARVPFRPSSNRLAQIVQRLLAKEPTARYADAAAVIHDLSVALGESVPPETTALRDSYLQAAPFVGRHAELAQLRNALDRIFSNPPSLTPGSAFLVGGESGVGKSRLMGELRTHAMIQGALVLEGQAVEGGGLQYQVLRKATRHLVLDVPLQPDQAAILKELVPDIETLLGREIPAAPNLDGHAARERLTQTLLDVFRGLRRPAVLLLEDLQWASASIFALNRLTAIASELPLLIVGSFRDDERPTLPEELPETQLIRLQRFSAPEIRKLAGTMLGAAGEREAVAQLLQRETEGNAFFLVEVARTLAEEAGSLERIGLSTLPPQVFSGGVQAVLRRRLRHVPEWGRTLLQLAAIAGRGLDLDLLGEIGGPADLATWLRVCAEAAVLEIYEQQWRFAHDKLREAVLADLPPATKPALYRRVAEAAESLYGDSPDHAGILADYWAEAGELEKASRYAEQAGANFRHLGANPRAIVYLQRALDWLPDDHPHRPAVYTDLGEIFYRVGEYQRARTLHERAIEMGQHYGDTLTVALAQSRLGDTVRWWRGELALAYTLYSTGLETLRGAGNLSALSQALNSLADLLGMWGRYDEGIALFHEGILLNQRTGLNRYELVLSANLGHIYFSQERFEDTLACYEHARAIAQVLGLRRDMIQMLENIGAVQAALGRIPLVLAALWASYYSQFEAKALFHQVFILSALGEGYALLGHYDLAQHLVQESLVMAYERSNIPVAADGEIHLAMTLLMRDHLDEALLHGRKAWDNAEKSEFPVRQANSGAIFGWALLANAQYTEAAQILSQASQIELAAAINYSALAAWGVACLYQDDLPGAIHAFLQAIERSIECILYARANWRAWFALALAEAGLALITGGGGDLARTAYQRAIEIAPYSGILSLERLKLHLLATAGYGTPPIDPSLLNDRP